MNITDYDKKIVANKNLTDKDFNYLVKKYGDDMVITLFINDIIKLSTTQKKFLKIGGIR